MDLITKQAKNIFAIPLALYGIIHLLMADNMTGMVPGYLPGGVLWIFLIGAAFIVTSVAIIMSKHAKLAGLVLGILLIVLALMFHLEGTMDGNHMAMSSFLKDVALAGGAFIVSRKG